MKTMKFGVEERIVLSTLQLQSSFQNLKLLREFREELSFDDLENKRLGFKITGNQTTWNVAAAKEKEVKVGDTIHKLVSDHLKQLDQKEQLGMEHVSLYENFCLEEDHGELKDDSKSER